jgi:phage terminase small subunit
VTVSRPRCPGQLGAAGRAFWRSIVAAYELSPAEVAMLAQACRVIDLLERIDAQLVAEDLTVAGSRGQERAHPLLTAAVEQRRSLESLTNALSLPMPNEIEGRRRSPAATAAAQARWRERRTS